jgi:hypothetical protein
MFKGFRGAWLRGTRDPLRAARPFLSNLVDVVGDRDNELLDELERLVRDKRERLKEKDKERA